jgi:Na+/melibiose symporter-like transporter
MTPKPRPRFPWSNLRTIRLVLAVILVAGLHVGLAGTVVAQSRWTDIAINVVAALIVVKIALIAWAYSGVRRRRASKTPTTPDATEQQRISRPFREPISTRNPWAMDHCWLWPRRNRMITHAGPEADPTAS